MLAALASNKTNIVIYQIIKQPFYFVLLFLRFIFINRRGWFKKCRFQKGFGIKLLYKPSFYTLCYTVQICVTKCVVFRPFFQGFPSVFRFLQKMVQKYVSVPHWFQCDFLSRFKFPIFQCGKKRFHRGNEKWTCNKCPKSKSQGVL